MLWDWNSIESVSRWTHGFFWASVVFIGLSFASQVISEQIFRVRKETLIGLHEAALAKEKEKTDARHEAEVAALRKQHEQAQARIAEVERLRSDRQLSATQRQKLIKALSRFAGEKIIVSCVMNDGEGQKFAREFMTVFEAAGLILPPGGLNQNAYGGRVPVGIEVTVNQEEATSGRAPALAVALVDALTGLGLVNKGGWVSPEVPVGAVEFRVGRKPPS